MTGHLTRCPRPFCGGTILWGQCLLCGRSPGAPPPPAVQHRPPPRQQGDPYEALARRIFDIPEAVAELTEGEGLSNRKAAEVLGVDSATVDRDRKTAANAASVPAEAIGPAEEIAANAAPPPEPETPPPRPRELG